MVNMAKKKFFPLKPATDRNLKKLSDGPGVYSLNKASGKSVYIGMAQSDRIEDRIREHKEKGEIPFRKVGVIETDTKAQARELEKRLIRERKPLYNIQGK